MVVYYVAAVIGLLLAALGLAGAFYEPGSPFLGVAAVGFGLMAWAGYFAPEDDRKKGQ